MAEITRYIDPVRIAVIDEARPAEPFWMTSNGSMTYTTINSAQGSRRRVVVTLEDLSEQYKYNKLVYAQMNITRLDSAAWISLATMPNGFPVAGTWNDTIGQAVNFQGFGYGQQLFPVPTNKSGSEALTASELSRIAKAILSAKTVVLYPGSANTSLTFYSSYYNLAGLQLYVRMDTAVTITSKPVGNGKTAGYINPYIDETFTWSLNPSGEYYCLADWEQTSAVFHWRNGTSGAWNDISVSGANQSVTLPANTFSVGTAQWYVTTTDDYGTTADSDIYTVTTADSSMVATAISPISTVEDGSAAIEFSWSASNDNGTTPTGADLQYSQDGETWTQFGHVDGAETTYTDSGGTFPAGAVMWRVRAYNADSAAGDWSEAVSFISVAAPGAPIVSAAAVPFTTVTWQSSGQQAYRITIDGVTYGPFFGSGKTYTPKDYLRDGIHTISVEIQGVYGLWSQAGSVTFTVANAPGDGITLSGSFDRDAALSWTTASGTADFLVYRDDKQIAATSVTGYTDRFVLGAHSYQVINRLPDGNYTASNVVNGVMRSCTTAIAPFNGGAWQELKLSENSYSEQRFSWAKLSSTRHVTGAVYPVIEVSEYEDAAGSYDVSFPDVASANAFLALRGQIVILKSRGGNVVIGALTQIEQANKDFYISFAFTIQRIDWEDYVDAQNS